MTYSDAIEYLFSRLPMFSRTGSSAFKPNLDNTITICTHLGNPHHKFKSVHIAGTNGKGSCSHMLAAAFQAAGYRTGLYTSPHLRDFRERIKVNGEMISRQYVSEFTLRMQPLIEKISPSFFELTVGMAFSYFAAERVDIAVIETGLGGRLDSTNVVTPELSVITNISMDHMNLLGDTPELIAAEKAGIIKENIPVVIGQSSMYTDQVFVSVASAKGSAISFADHHWYTENWNHVNGLLATDLAHKEQGHRLKCELDLPGYYQLKNLVTVSEAIVWLRKKGFDITDEKFLYALRNVKKLTGLHGRWETIHQRPAVILDVAHNEDGIRELMKQVELSDYHDLHIVIGIVKDKDTEKTLSLLPRNAKYYFTQAQIPRALPAEALRHNAEALGLTGVDFPEVNAALKAALAKAHEKDLILVCGSVFTVGEVLPIHT